MFLEIGFIFLGLIGLLMRRNLIAIGFSFILVFLGVLVWLYRLHAAEIALVLSFVFSFLILVYGAVIVFVWRHRGTLHIDEIREIRG